MADKLKELNIELQEKINRLAWFSIENSDEVILDGRFSVKELEEVITVSYTHLTLPTNREV